jgi:undecaprenyl-diphosphatase
MSIEFIFLGAVFFLVGCTYRNAAMARWDRRTFRALHSKLSQFAPFFRILWHLGRTPFTLLVVFLLAAYKLPSGMVAGAVFTLAATMEGLIKKGHHRRRPFRELADVQMGQPQEPQDPSFPSGDSLRAWFLALTVPATFELTLAFRLGACFLAALVTLGRVAMGVHYPLDTLAGAGLGVLAAGLAMVFL